MLKLFTLCITNIKTLKKNNKLLYGEKKKTYHMVRDFWDTLYIMVQRKVL